jgi:PAS domain S-box-containing protein
MKLYSWNIRRKLYLLVACSVVPALLIILYTGLTQKKAALEDAEKNLENITSAFVVLQLEKTIQSKSFLQAIANMPEVKNLDIPKCTIIFQDILRNNSDFENISILTPQGDVRTAARMATGDLNRSDRFSFKEAIRTKSFSVGEYDVSRRTKEPILQYSLPVIAVDGSISSILFATYNLNRYAETVRTLTLPDGSRFVLLDRNGARLLSYATQSTPSPIGERISPGHWLAINDSPEDSGHFIGTRDDGGQAIYRFSKLRLAPGEPPYAVILMNTPLSVVLHNANHSLRTNLVLLVAAAFSALFIARMLCMKLVGYQVDMLRESAENLQDIIQTAVDGFWLMDTQGRLLQVNEAYCRMSGYSEQELLTMRISDLEAIENADDIAAHIHNGIEHGFDRFETRHFRKDGSMFDVDVVCQYKHRDGGILIIFLKDITERKRSEQALHESEEKFKKIFASTPEPIALTGWNDARFIDANDAYITFIGYGRDELVGAEAKSLNVWVTDQERLRYRQLLEQHGKIRNFESSRRTKSGEIRDVVASAELLTLHGETCILSILKDITEQKRMQEVMVQTEKMMSVGGLAAGMAHEINNPLAAILQSAQVMATRLSPDAEVNRVVAAQNSCSLQNIHDYLESRGIMQLLAGIRDAGSRAARIVSNMLEFSRRGESKYDEEDINSLLEHAVELASSDYDLKKNYDFKLMAIRRDYAQNLPPVQCSRTEIEQVVLNLLTNAAQAMSLKNYVEDNPTITLRTYAQGNNVVLEVGDNGPGMEESVRKRVFEPFYTTKPPGQGTGLGLSVSYFIIVNNHSGILDVESTLGEGTRFFVRMPVAQPIEKN